MIFWRRASADAVDEVGVVIAAGLAVRAGLDVIGEPRFVGVVAVDAEIAVGPVENVADGVRLCVFRTERSGLLSGAHGFFSVGFFAALASRLDPRAERQLAPYAPVPISASWLVIQWRTSISIILRLPSASSK